MVHCRKAIADGIHSDTKYRSVAYVRLVGMQLEVLVNNKHYKHVKNVAVDTVGTGILGKMVQTHCFLKRDRIKFCTPFIFDREIKEGLPSVWNCTTPLCVLSIHIWQPALRKLNEEIRITMTSTKELILKGIRLQLKNTSTIYNFQHTRHYFVLILAKSTGWAI